jgi:restriction system protein
MSIPDFEALLLPILRLLGDGLKHSSGEIHERLRGQFEMTPQELRTKNKKGKTMFDNNVDLALANLQGAPHGRTKAIEKVEKGVYRITERGKVHLKANLTSLTVRDL